MKVYAIKAVVIIIVVLVLGLIISSNIEKPKRIDRLKDNIV